ncbi:type II secretion system F family protein [Chitinimonas arctica]|uniref:Type II secretion system F family protein n=1 Tax=Chitinimonas arctica TaxID=2594795 RepID=A0A516SEC9_9NEIS|nr:type II secretion system F family protein [Chitinimonas arctica]QDQ26512.1 type II secretion system F family protein [Chitinimonas arctica]
MQFKYRAIDQSGRLHKGSMDASNAVDLEARLGRLGMDLIESRAYETRPGLFARTRIGRGELITFCFHMEQMTRASVPLLEGLTDLRDTMDHPRFRAIIANVIEDIEGGLQLSQALANHPLVFPTVFVNLIQAGEATGRLPDVFLNLVETLKWQDELAAQAKKLMMYPLFVGSVVMCVVIFLLVWLVPKLVGFIQTMQQELPWNTRLLIALSDFAVQRWYVVLLVIAAGFGGWWAWKISDPRYQFKVDRLKLRLPYIGPILEKIVLARFASYFALMYDAGIAILDSIRILEGVVGNQMLAKGMQEVRAQIAEGQGVAASFERVRLFPPLVIRMLRVGENTGALDKSLQNVAYFYNREVKESIERVQALIEPMMTVFLGFIIGFVMLSVLGPIYDLLTKIKF